MKPLTPYPYPPRTRLAGWACLLLAAIALLHGHGFGHGDLCHGPGTASVCAGDDAGGADAHELRADAENDCALCLLVPHGPSGLPVAGESLAVSLPAARVPRDEPRTFDRDVRSPLRGPPARA